MKKLLALLVVVILVIYFWPKPEPEPVIHTANPDTLRDTTKGPVGGPLLRSSSPGSQLRSE